MIGIILAAGDGVRFCGTAEVCDCKPLKIIGDNRLIEYALDNLIRLNVSECVIVVGRFSDEIRKAVTDNYKGIKISYVIQNHRKGIVNAFMVALGVIGTDERIVLQLSDEIYDDFDAQLIMDIVEKGTADFYCGIVYEDDKEAIKANYSVSLTKKMKMLGCVEKPLETDNNIKGTGFCVFNPLCLKCLTQIYNEALNTPEDLCDYMNYLISKKKTGLCIPIAKKEFNINTHDEFLRAKNYFQK